MPLYCARTRHLWPRSRSKGCPENAKQCDRHVRARADWMRLAMESIVFPCRRQATSVFGDARWLSQFRGASMRAGGSTRTRVAKICVWSPTLRHATSPASHDSIERVNPEPACGLAFLRAEAARMVWTPRDIVRARRRPYNYTTPPRILAARRARLLRERVNLAGASFSPSLSHTLAAHTRTEGATQRRPAFPLPAGQFPPSRHHLRNTTRRAERVSAQPHAQLTGCHSCRWMTTQRAVGR